MTDGPQRTEFAQQAFDFSDLFGYKFGRQTYGGQRPRRLRLQEPDGPSTAGGRQARQSLVLIPDRGEGNLVIGWIDTKQHQAELKTFEVLRDQFVARYSMPIDLERDVYRSLCKELEGFLKVQRIGVRTVSPKRASADEDPPGPTTGPSVLLLVGVLLTGVAIGLWAGFLLFRG